MPRKLVTFSDNAALDRQIGEISRTAVDNRFVFTVVSPGSGVEFSIKHGLDRVPAGYVLAGSSEATVALWDGTTPSDKETLYLQVSAGAGAVFKVLVF